MKDMNNNSMVEALRRRRGKGVDISIVLGEPNEIKSQMHGDQNTGDDEAKDLAPEVENESPDVKDQELAGTPVVNGDAVDCHDDEKQDMSMLAKLLGKNSLLARHLKK